MAFWKKVTAWRQKDQRSIIDEWEKGQRLVYGYTTRNYLTTFGMFDGGSGRLDRKQLLKALSSIGLYPSKSQIFNMLKTSVECHDRPDEDAQLFVTFGDFCIYASDLMDGYNNDGYGQTCTTSSTAHRPAQQRPSITSRYDVFLGGSCNPTTWRKDTAIPMLKRYNLSFYNPHHFSSQQVEDWGPELIEIEDQAKNNARLLLFVLENSTRSIASMVEAAFHSGDQRLLMLVIKGIPDEVEGEKLEASELQDLKRGHAFLCDLVERQCLPIFEDLETAIHCSAKVLQQGVSIRQLTPEDGAQPVRNPHIRVADRLINIKETFRSYQSLETGKLPLSDTKLALKVLSGKEASFPALQQIISRCSSQEKDFEFDFDQFCCLLTEFEQLQPYRRAATRWYYSAKRYLYGGMSTPAPPVEQNMRRDIFLGGSCRDTEWRKEVIPLFRKMGLTMYDPQRPHWNLRFLPLEAQAKANSDYMLYVISSTSRGIAAMVEVAHFIGQKRKVVLCIQHLQEGCTIDGEELSSRSIKDYNRGRCYLADLASRQGTPIFDNVVEAAKSLIARIQRDRSPSSMCKLSKHETFQQQYSHRQHERELTPPTSGTISEETRSKVDPLTESKVSLGDVEITQEQSGTSQVAGHTILSDST
ncbi:uncharacterized protein [Apostichopus japonicus]|uniref:uncharacterized protein isoform X3 n=1 Tax=Stichopus japonicus TaxID=307972 RepID=UPI003AB7FB8D